MKMSYEPSGMHAGVGTRRAENPDRSTLEIGERLLDDLLDAERVFLVLPAGVRGTVIGDHDLVLAELDCFSRFCTAGVTKVEVSPPYPAISLTIDAVTYA